MTDDLSHQPRLLSLARELEQVLEYEFQALQSQELERFERLQPGKTALLAELAQLCPPAQDLSELPAWAELRESLATSRDLHRRNAILIDRKLEAIRGALSSLQASNPASGVEIYDRLGKVARFTKGRGYHDV